MISPLNRDNTMTFLVLGIVLLVPLIFYGTTVDMIRVWIVNQTFTHGFLIFPISFWLVWRKRGVLSQLTVEPEPRIFVLLFAILLAWLLANMLEINLVEQLALISLVLTSIWLLLGQAF